ncbi:MAG: DUF3825 domain-containing protein [Synechococcales cyanobacterium RM1_1_8]|nr:DUF3825 domain-containing protein [Synechococcales cyanobacterium RM1_1_8]
MVLFLNRLQRLIQTLLRLIGIRPQRRHSPESLGDRPAPRPPSAAPSHATSQETAGPTILPAATPSITPELRRVIYQALYDMGRGGAWVDLAPLGGSLKQRDPSFSSQTYGGFQRLTDLLEAAPDLVDLDRSQNRARLKQPADLKRLLQGALTQLAGNPADGNDWIHLSSIKLKLNEIYPEFSIPKYGYEKFKDFLADRPDLIELRRDESALHPIYYGRLKPSARPAPPPQPKPPLPLPTKPSDKLAIAGRSPSPKPKLPNLAANPSANPSASLSANLSANPSASFSPSDYGDFARSATICTKLAALALPEPWHWGPATSPPAHPILSHYLNYSFLRLHQEGKVLVSASGTYSAFHTGLLDRKYEPIYALFVALSGEERRSKQAAWSLFDFCVPGEGSAGKTLVNQFDALPERANYFTQPEAAFYDCNAEAPMVDWRHILQDNSDRLPLGFGRPIAHLALPCAISVSCPPLSKMPTNSSLPRP